jgi:hypothetical protein
MKMSTPSSSEKRFAESLVLMPDRKRRILSMTLPKSTS